MNKGRLPKCSTEHAGHSSYRSLKNKFKEIRICCFTSQWQEAEAWSSTQPSAMKQLGKKSLKECKYDLDSNIFHKQSSSQPV